MSYTKTLTCFDNLGDNFTESQLALGLIHKCDGLSHSVCQILNSHGIPALIIGGRFIDESGDCFQAEGHTKVVYWDEEGQLYSIESTKLSRSSEPSNKLKHAVEEASTRRLSLEEIKALADQNKEASLFTYSQYEQATDNLGLEKKHQDAWIESLVFITQKKLQALTANLNKPEKAIKLFKEISQAIKDIERMIEKNFEDNKVESIYNSRFALYQIKKELAKIKENPNNQEACKKQIEHAILNFKQDLPSIENLFGAKNFFEAYVHSSDDTKRDINTDLGVNAYQLALLKRSSKTKYLEKLSTMIADMGLFKCQSATDTLALLQTLIDINDEDLTINRSRTIIFHDDELRREVEARLKANGKTKIHLNLLNQHQTSFDPNQINYTSFGYTTEDIKAAKPTESEIASLGKLLGINVKPLLPSTLKVMEEGLNTYTMYKKPLTVKAYREIFLEELAKQNPKYYRQIKQYIEEQISIDHSYDGHILDPQTRNKISELNYSLDKLKRLLSSKFFQSLSISSEADKQKPIGEILETQEYKAEMPQYKTLSNFIKLLNKANLSLNDLKESDIIKIAKRDFKSLTIEELENLVLRPIYESMQKQLSDLGLKIVEEANKQLGFRATMTQLNLENPAVIGKKSISKDSLVFDEIRDFIEKIAQKNKSKSSTSQATRRYSQIGFIQADAKRLAPGHTIAGKIDWNLYARTDELHEKLFEDDSARPKACYILDLNSLSTNSETSFKQIKPLLTKILNNIEIGKEQTLYLLINGKAIKLSDKELKKQLSFRSTKHEKLGEMKDVEKFILQLVERGAYIHPERKPCMIKDIPKNEEVLYLGDTQSTTVNQKLLISLKRAGNKLRFEKRLK